jgi:single-stranded-DNA-specific exonuclease
MKGYTTGTTPDQKTLANLNFLSPLMAGLLAGRGITERRAAEEFLAPDYNAQTHDPFLLRGMTEAVERILKAVEKKERIAIYSDYDMDGIPGAVVLSDFFQAVGFTNFRVHIPHRNRDGFGLNLDAIEELAAGGVKLIITIDCGITDVVEVARARELGLEVIITDHHLPPQPLPAAVAIIDPHQENCSYPFKDLCGAALAYKLVQGLLVRGEFSLVPGWEKWLLDMVGMATIADMVPLVGENRVLATYGLKVLRKSRRPGLLALLAKAGIKQQDLTEEDIGFTIGPRINAASRMDKADDAFDLLSTHDGEVARRAAAHLETINNERKGVVASMVREAHRKLKEREVKEVIVIGSPDWQPGLLGLLANSLADEFDRPVFVWGRGQEKGEEILKGSCRSNGRVSLVELMRATPAETFLGFGGHNFSGGFTLAPTAVHTLEMSLVTALGTLTQSVADLPVVDCTSGLDELTWQFYNELVQLAPFGTGNPNPLLLVKDVALTDVAMFGKAKNHLKLTFTTGGDVKEAIAFFTTTKDFSRLPVAGEKVSLLAHLERSTFGYRPSLRLRIVDVI